MPLIENQVVKDPPSGSEGLGSDGLGSDGLGSEDSGSEGHGSDDLGSEDIGSEDIGSEDIGTKNCGSEDCGSEDLGSEVENLESKYLVEAPFGQGGFGSVYNGSRIEDGVKVAIKFVLKEKIEDWLWVSLHSIFISPVYFWAVFFCCDSFEKNGFYPFS